MKKSNLDPVDFTIEETEDDLGEAIEDLLDNPAVPAHDITSIMVKVGVQKKLLHTKTFLYLRYSLSVLVCPNSD